ncbi:MAG: hypothetical protein IKJ86_04305, partial [Clostridia bacterium]|nr:hypothetical protein [Clostridia bacterium]
RTSKATARSMAACRSPSVSFGVTNPRRRSSFGLNKSLPPEEETDEDLPFGPGKIITTEESEPEQLAFSYAAGN